MSLGALIVAGGLGKRMGAIAPKQFLLLSGKPILGHTLEAFANSSNKPIVYLVMHPDYFQEWAKLCLAYEIPIKFHLVAGGKSRSESVKNGLKEIQSGKFGKLPEFLAIHDAVRPLIRPEWIDLGYHEAIQFGSSIPCIGLRDSLRRIQENNSHTMNREEFRLVQTPQIFEFEKLFNSYENIGNQTYSDDASVWESCGHKIHLSQGNEENIKITYSLDLIIAEAIINQRKNPKLGY